MHGASSIVGDGVENENDCLVGGDPGTRREGAWCAQEGGCRVIWRQGMNLLEDLYWKRQKERVP